MSDTLDIILNDSRWAAENPILALKRKPASGALHVLTVGEVVPARLFFYDGPEGAASLATARKNPLQIGLFAKLVRKDGDVLLFGTTAFTELQDARGDYGYSCSLNLLTDELKNAFNQGFDGTAFVDIRINGVRVHQFKLPIRPRTYAGTELDTHPAAEGLLEEMQAAAAEADADAAAANAAKVAAETARDESVTAKNTAVTKAGEAATSETNAGNSASAAATSESNAAASAAAAEVSKNNAQHQANVAESFKNDAQVSAAAAAELAAGIADKLGKGDARVQALGGVSLIGDNGGTAGWGHVPAVPQLSEYFELYFKCRRGATVGVSDRRAIAAITTDDGEHVALNFGNATASADCYVGFNNAYGALGAAIGDLSWKHVTYGRDPVGYFVTVDGVKSYNNNFGITGKPVAIERVYGGPQGGHGQYHGDVSVAIAFNFPLSDAQRAKLLLNEPGADILGRGRSLMPEITGWVSQSGGDLVLSNVTATGFSAVSAAGSYNRADTTTTIGDVPSSRRLRAKVTLAGASEGGAPTLQRVIGSNLSQFPEYAIQLVNGTAVYELPGFVGFDRFALALVQHPAYGNTAASSYTFTLESLEVLGVSGRWEPLNWTGSGRGVDSSGNGNDIIPIGKGVAPLNPATGLIRVIKGTVAGASVSSGAVGSVGTLTPTTVGLDAIRAGDALTASWGTVRPANAGGVTAYATTDGAATLETAAHGAGVTVSAGTAVNIIHHLN